jgi:tripartite-type tricarboxylate transporter receptor subunit TctC
MVRRADVGERLTALGIEPEGNSPAEFLAQIRTEIAAWGKVIQAAMIPRE